MRLYSRRLLSNLDASQRSSEAAVKRARAVSSQAGNIAAADGGDGGPCLGAETGAVPFAQLAQCDDEHEVARMFLAALQVRPKPRSPKCEPVSVAPAVEQPHFTSPHPLPHMQLTNAGNVSIEAKGELDAPGSLSFSLKLISLDDTFTLEALG